MKPSKKSAGILMFRRCASTVEVLLVHPGGPFWARKDDGAWMIPKGEFTDEEPLAAAKREFTEELGFPPSGNLIELAPIQQRGGKWVYAWALEGDCNTREIRSNAFEMEWLPRSGKYQSFPEVDRAEWFDFATAEQKILPSQIPLLHQLQAMLAATR